MKKGSPIRLILIIVLGFIGGIIFISPLLSVTDEDCSRKNRLICEILFSLGFNYNQIMGGFLGILALFLLIIPFILFINPKTREKIKGFYKNLATGYIQILTYPTQLPITFGFLWLLIFFILITSNLLDSFLPQYQEIILSLLFFPFLFLLGLSGFLIIKRKETIDRFGQVHKGAWALFNGGLLALFGWGTLVFLVLAKIFNW